MYTIIYNYTKKKSVRCLTITVLCQVISEIIFRVATKIFDDFRGALCKELIIGPLH